MWLTGAIDRLQGADSEESSSEGGGMPELGSGLAVEMSGGPGMPMGYQKVVDDSEVNYGHDTDIAKGHVASSSLRDEWKVKNF